MKPDGTPELSNLRVLLGQAQEIPYNQMSHVDKMFPLSPLPMGVMLTGISSIGNRTVKTLIAEFTRNDKAFAPVNKANYTVRSISERLLAFLRQRYDAEYGEQLYKPELELIVGGYSRNDQTPTIERMLLHEGRIETPLDGDGYGIVFGGQMEWIQRIVFGTDATNKIRIAERAWDLLGIYRTLAEHELQAHGLNVRVPTVDAFRNALRVFDGWDLDGLDANWGDFSEQNAVDCVDFFVDVMIKSQQFSERLPTVGGDVHVAIIRKEGFRFVSREALRHRDHAVPLGG